MAKQDLREAVEVVNTELVFPSNTNHYNTIFGGRILELMDMTGALAAIRFAKEEVVTASMEAVDFKKPIKVGDIVELKARVIYSARTSMVVRVEVFRVRKFVSGSELTCKGYLVFVAVDAEGIPIPVPKLKVSSEEDKKLWKIGETVKRNRAVRAKAEA